MGAVCCKPEEEELGGDPTFGSTRVKSWRRCKWRSDEPITESQLQRMREQYWDTEPHYGGDRVIWQALKAACEADLETARVILDSAGVIVAAADMTICYDERGSKYELPRFVISPPSNLARDPPDGSKAGGDAAEPRGGQLELPAVAAGAGGGGAAERGADAPANQVAVR